jgi:hypothetical protein
VCELSILGLFTISQVSAVRAGAFSQAGLRRRSITHRSGKRSWHLSSLLGCPFLEGA